MDELLFHVVGTLFCSSHTINREQNWDGMLDSSIGHTNVVWDKNWYEKRAKISVCKCRAAMFNDRLLPDRSVKNRKCQSQNAVENSLSSLLPRYCSPSLSYPSNIANLDPECQCQYCPRSSLVIIAAQTLHFSYNFLLCRLCCFCCLC